ncbi:hypothetical protein [Nocardioides conyzicola]|uniref:Uncharacterized protein n=1 Tax=Nocardioides conyzicola TaxID=1651781 RepID=A0ABP8WQN9_9ACTN
MKTIIALIVLLWLAIGALAAYQRDYFTNDQDVSCKSTGDTALTIVAGPLNYFGANPKVDCKVNVPQPSK